MSTTPHPLAQLSAYLDGALAPAERAAVAAHLDTCDDCRARLAELRGTARLIAALPSPVPTRRLVPRVAPVPAWLAPLRTLSTLASAVAVFLFIATALLANIGSLASSGASTTSASQLPLLVPAGGAAAPAPTTAFRNAATAGPAAAQDAAKSGASASANAAAQATAAASPEVQFVASSPVTTTVTVTYIGVFSSPWLWLGIAIATAALAILLQRRLRRA